MPSEQITSLPFWQADPHPGSLRIDDTEIIRRLESVEQKIDELMRRLKERGSL